MLCVEDENENDDEDERTLFWRSLCYLGGAGPGVPLRSTPGWDGARHKLPVPLSVL